LRKGWMTFVLLVVAQFWCPRVHTRSGRHDGATKGQTGPNIGVTWIRTTLPASRQGTVSHRHSKCEESRLPALRFEYKSGPLKISLTTATRVRVNYAPGNGNFLIVGDKRYELTQFHFHRPSEEYIHGKPYDMVVHLMHQASDGKVAAVAVLLQAGSANATIQQLWEHMPKDRGKEQEIAGVEVQSRRPAAPRHLLLHLHGVANRSALH
jgi:carbonic anhydrase